MLSTCEVSVHSVVCTCLHLKIRFHFEKWLKGRLVRISYLLEMQAALAVCQTVSPEVMEVLLKADEAESLLNCSGLLDPSGGL